MPGSSTITVTARPFTSSETDVGMNTLPTIRLCLFKAAYTPFASHFECPRGPLGRCPMSELGLGRVKTPTFNLRVEIPSRFRKFENQKCLRPLLRDDDRENNSAHSWLVHVFTQPESKAEKLNVKRGRDGHC